MVSMQIHKMSCLAMAHLTYYALKLYGSRASMHLPVLVSLMDQSFDPLKNFGDVAGAGGTYKAVEITFNASMCLPSFFYQYIHPSIHPLTVW